MAVPGTDAQQDLGFLPTNKVLTAKDFGIDLSDQDTTIAGTADGRLVSADGLLSNGFTIHAEYDADGQRIASETIKNNLFPVPSFFETVETVKFDPVTQILRSATILDGGITKVREYNPGGKLESIDETGAGFHNRVTYNPATGKPISEKDHSILGSLDKEFDSDGKLRSESGTGAGWFTSIDDIACGRIGKPDPYLSLK